MIECFTRSKNHDQRHLLQPTELLRASITQHPRKGASVGTGVEVAGHRGRDEPQKHRARLRPDKQMASNRILET